MKKMMMWFTWRQARAGVKAGVIAEVDREVEVTPTVDPGVDHILILHIPGQDPEVIDTVTVDLEADPTLIHHTHQGQDPDLGLHQYHVEEVLQVSWTEGESQGKISLTLRTMPRWIVLFFSARKRPIPYHRPTPSPSSSDTESSNDDTSSPSREKKK